MGYRGFIVPLTTRSAWCEQCGKTTQHVYLGDVKHAEDRTKQCNVCGLKTLEQVKKGRL